MTKQSQHICRTLDHIASGSINTRHPGITQKLITLRGDDAARDNLDIRPSIIAQQIDELRNQCLVTGSQTGCADHVDVLFQREIERLLRRLEQGSAYRSQEHTSELKSLMRISYAVFCLKKKKT